MKTRAVDQVRLEGLKLLARNDVVMNIDNHRSVLSL
jgi:hypothetical protein